MINKLSKFDIILSKYIHYFDNYYLNIILFPFAIFFNPNLFIIFIGFISWLYDFKKTVILLYIVSIIVAVIITLSLKKFFDRKRPEIIIGLKKSQLFRKKESNCSMPSGDAMQSAVFATYIINFMINNNYSLYNEIIMLLFVIVVSFSRVFFLCHYLGDTLVGIIIGFFIGYITVGII